MNRSKETSVVMRPTLFFPFSFVSGVNNQSIHKSDRQRKWPQVLADVFKFSNLLPKSWLICIRTNIVCDNFLIQATIKKEIVRIEKTVIFLFHYFTKIIAALNIYSQRFFECTISIIQTSQFKNDKIKSKLYL